MRRWGASLNQADKFTQLGADLCGDRGRIAAGIHLNQTMIASIISHRRQGVALKLSVATEKVFAMIVWTNIYRVSA